MFCRFLLRTSPSKIPRPSQEKPLRMRKVAVGHSPPVNPPRRKEKCSPITERDGVEIRRSHPNKETLEVLLLIATLSVRHGLEILAVAKEPLNDFPLLVIHGQAKVDTGFFILVLAALFCVLTVTHLVSGVVKHYSELVALPNEANVAQGKAARCLPLFCKLCFSVCVFIYKKSGISKS